MAANMLLLHKAEVDAAVAQLNQALPNTEMDIIQLQQILSTALDKDLNEARQHTVEILKLLYSKLPPELQTISIPAPNASEGDIDNFITTILKLLNNYFTDIKNGLLEVEKLKSFNNEQFLLKIQNEAGLGKGSRLSPEYIKIRQEKTRQVLKQILDSSDGLARQALTDAIRHKGASLNDMGKFIEQGLSSMTEVNIGNIGKVRYIMTTKGNIPLNAIVNNISKTANETFTTNKSILPEYATQILEEDIENCIDELINQYAYETATSKSIRMSRIEEIIENLNFDIKIEEKIGDPTMLSIWGQGIINYKQASKQKKLLDFTQLESANTELKKYLLQQLKFTNPKLTEAFTKSFDEMISTKPDAFFSIGNNAQDITGKLGELQAKMYFNLLGVKNEWVGSLTNAAGEEFSADLWIPNFDEDNKALTASTLSGFGIQVKNSISGNTNISFASKHFNGTGKSSDYEIQGALAPILIRGGVTPGMANKIAEEASYFVEEVTYLDNFNVEYMFNGGQAVHSSNPEFKLTRQEITTLAKAANNVMTSCMQALMHIQVASNSLNDFESNTLYIINGLFTSSFSILQSIQNQLADTSNSIVAKSGYGTTSTFRHANLLENAEGKRESIVEYINSNRVNWNEVRSGIVRTSSFNFSSLL